MANDSARITILEQRLQSLTTQLRGSPGVSTAGAGSLSIRTLQLGFAAELTSSFSTSDGYFWKRLKLENGVFSSPSVQLTGCQAYALDGDETIAVGTVVWLEPSPDAVGWVIVRGGGGSGGSAFGCSTFHGLIRSGFCGTLSQVSALGSCSCVPSNTISLTWDTDADAAVGAADDPILGCPPGVTTTLCPDGAPNKFKIVVSGFTAPNTNLNQTYTVTYTTGEVWSQTKNGVTATLTAVTATGNFNFTLDDGTYTVAYSTGMAVPLSCCTDVSLELDDADGTSGTPATLTALVATACGAGTEYTPYLDLCTTTCEGPKPRLRLVPTSGGTGSATIVCTPVGCGTDGDGSPYMDFATSDPAICTGTLDECGENAVVFRVMCSSCGGPISYQFDCCESPIELPYQLCLSVAAGTCGFSTTKIATYAGETSPGVVAWSSKPTGTPLTNEDVGAILGCVDGVLTWRMAWGEDGGLGNCLAFGGVAADCNALLPASVETVVVDTVSDCHDCTSLQTSTMTASAADGCAVESYNCLGSGSCIDPGDGSGEYATIADCIAECAGGGGGGGTVADCDACGLSGQTATLVCSYGTFTATWTGAAGVYSVTFTDGSFTGSIKIDCVSGVQLTLTRYDAGGVQLCTVAATSSTCGPPAVFTFDGICTGGGTATVTT